MAETQDAKAATRYSIRLARAQVSPKEQIEKAQQLMRIVIQLPEFMGSQHIAAYWPNDGEINPLSILATAHEMKKSCYLPKLGPAPTIQMQFMAYLPGDYLTANRLGILEPSLIDRKTIPADALDLTLVPLIAFDEKGQRLGMGKGYYDHTFAFRKNDSKAKPFLLGLAYDLQKVSQVPSEKWDIPLDGIATETGYINFKDLL